MEFSCPQGISLNLQPTNLGRDNISGEIGRLVHYECMALAKKTSVLREAMFSMYEPRRFMCPAEYADIF